MPNICRYKFQKKPKRTTGEIQHLWLRHGKRKPKKVFASLATFRHDVTFFHVSSADSSEPLNYGGTNPIDMAIPTKAFHRQFAYGSRAYGTE